MNEIMNEIKFPSMTFGYDVKDNLELITIDGEQFVHRSSIGRIVEHTKLLPTETRVVEFQCSSCWESFNLEVFGDNETPMPRFCPWCGREVEW